MGDTWSYLRAHISNGRTDLDFSRTAAIEADYQVYKRSLAAIGWTPSEYVRQVHLQGASSCLIRNGFPYDFPGNISHYVLFAGKPLLKRTVSLIIRQNFPGRETLWFVNTPDLQSIKDLWHCHIFVKDS